MNKKAKERISGYLIIFGSGCISVGLGEAMYEAHWPWYWKLVTFGVVFILLGGLWGSSSEPGPQAKTISEAERTARHGDGPPTSPPPRR